MYTINIEDIANFEGSQNVATINTDTSDYFSAALTSDSSGSIKLDGGSIEFDFVEIWSHSKETSKFSFECWFIVDSTEEIILFQPHTAEGPVPGNYINIKDNLITFKVTNSSPLKATKYDTTVQHIIDDESISHHLVASYESGYLKLYIDGKLVDSVKTAYTIEWNFIATKYVMSGPVTVDAIAIYKNVLSEGAIQRHYVLGRSTVGSQEIAKYNSGTFFPINDTDSIGVLDIDYPQDESWPYSSKTSNVTTVDNVVQFKNITSPDTVDDNIFFTGGAFQLIPGTKLISDDMSTFNKGVNMLENASFDVDIDGDGVPDNWTVSSDNEDSYVALSSEFASSQNAIIIASVNSSEGEVVGIAPTNSIEIMDDSSSTNPNGIYPRTLQFSDSAAISPGASSVLHFDLSATGSLIQSAIYDLSRYGNNGQAANLHFSSDNGGVMHFDGEQYLSVNSHSSLNVNEFTMTMAYKSLSQSGTQTLMIRHLSSASATGAPLHLYQSSSSLIFAHNGTDIHTLTMPDVDTWFIATVTYDLSNMKFYINGQLSDTQSRTDATSSSSEKLVIGALDDGSNASTGTFAGARVYNTALNSNQVLDEFNAMRARLYL